MNEEEQELLARTAAAATRLGMAWCEFWACVNELGKLRLKQR